jgi:hypothetical protein
VLLCKQEPFRKLIVAVEDDRDFPVRGEACFNEMTGGYQRLMRAGGHARESWIGQEREGGRSWPRRSCLGLQIGKGGHGEAG